MITANSIDSSPGVISAVTPKLPVTVDTKGRVRTSREQRRLILAEFERSGVSAVQFARRTGLKYSTLAGWVARCRRAKGRDRVGPVRLLEAVVAPPTPAAGLQVRLPGGAQVEIGNAGQVALAAALVRALEKSC